MPVKKDEKEPESVPYSPTVPLDQLPSHAVSSHLVSEVSDPIPFIIGQYSAHTLPEKLTFDGTWMRKAFKPETYYSIVVAAFTKTSVSYNCSVLAAQTRVTTSINWGLRICASYVQQDACIPV